jgi:hypothetical protein
MISTHRKGWVWRRKIEKWFEEAGFVTTTRGIGFSGDDILAVRQLHYLAHDSTGLPTYTLRLSVEAKDHQTITLAAFVDQAVKQAAMYPAESGTLPVAIIHRKGRPDVDNAYVVMPGWAFIELVTR